MVGNDGGVGVRKGRERSRKEGRKLGDRGETMEAMSWHGLLIFMRFNNMKRNFQIGGKT